MSDDARIDPFTTTLFKATVKLAAATDTCYILANDMEDAVDQLRLSFEDMNVLYITSVERLSGTVYITQAMRDYLGETPD